MEFFVTNLKALVAVVICPLAILHTNIVLHFCLVIHFVSVKRAIHKTQTMGKEEMK